MIVWTSKPGGVYRVNKTTRTRPATGSGEPWDLDVVRVSFELFEDGASLGTYPTLKLAKDAAAWRGGEGPLSFRDDRRPRFVPRTRVRRTSVRVGTPVRVPAGRSIADLF